MGNFPPRAGLGRRSRGKLADSFLRLAILVFALANVCYPQINHIQTATRLLSDGQFQQAEVEARQALDNPTSRALGLALLGTIRLQQGNYDESANFLNQALALNPRLVGARTTLGNAYMLQGKPDLARKNFQKVLQLDPSNFNARFDLAKVEASLHNYAQSLALAAPIAPQLHETEDGILFLATNYGSLRKKEELRRLVSAWHQLPTPSDDSTLEFGNTLALFGMTTEAQQVFGTVQTKLSEYPNAALALNLAKSYLSLSALDRAEQNFQLALSFNSACVPCETGLAEIAERQGDTEKALAHLITAKKQAPEDPEILFQFGKVCLQRNLPDDALPALTKAAALKPDQDPYVYVLASAHVAKGNLSDAASLFGRLLKKHPADPVLLYAMGAVDFLQGQYDEAESSLKQSLKTQPDQVAASYYLGLTYDALGQDDRSIAAFRDLLRTHPGHAPSYTKLGSILLRRHQYDEAQPLLERAISLDPGSVQAHYQLGLLLRRLGKTADADFHLAQSRKLEAERSSQTELKLRLLLPD